jgi:NADH:ubiquinone oxidoreductase subunit K
VIVLEPLINYFLVSLVLFAVGVYGLIAKRNALRMIFAIEFIINAANINFVAFSRYMGIPQALGQTFALFVIALAAAEVAVGLTLILIAFRLNKDIDVFNLRRLRG